MGKLSPNIGLSGELEIDFKPSAEGVSPAVEGMSLSIRPVEGVLRELAQSDVPVLLLAEHGAGKHVTAKRIHQLSRRSAQPFRRFECSALEPRDLESALQEARSGTIYLQELGDLNAECQAHLQNALSPAANDAANEVAARFICGSTRDLEAEVRSRRLREDLYYRISGVCLRLPPLRQRKEDIPVLMEHFLAEYSREFRRSIPNLSSETRQLFQDYSWPGNLRELADAARVLAAVGDEKLAMGGLRALLHKGQVSGNGSAMSLKAAARAASHEAEKELILRTLTRTRWNRRQAAAELQISYKALLYKLKQIGHERYGTS